MTDRKPGQKTLRFLGKRFRFGDGFGDCCVYANGQWLIEIASARSWCDCSLSYKGKTVARASTVGHRASAYEAAISDCEQRALALFKQLGDLCGYEVEG